jgi:non-ribosomal peptide synthetase component F
MSGDLVGIYMDKSCEMIISIFAIHKAGGGFVPLDPEHPPERIRTILGLAESKIVLTSRDLQQQLDEAMVGTNIASFVVDVHELSLSRRPDVGLVTRSDKCYVIFTSGSTGTPKGTRTAFSDLQTRILSHFRRCIEPWGCHREHSWLS